MRRNGPDNLALRSQYVDAHGRFVSADYLVVTDHEPNGTRAELLDRSVCSISVAFPNGLAIRQRGTLMDLRAAPFLAQHRVIPLANLTLKANLSGCVYPQLNTQQQCTCI
jgi:hypothetical protein